jgi:hypothetical protein
MWKMAVVYGWQSGGGFSIDTQNNPSCLSGSALCGSPAHDWATKTAVIRSGPGRRRIRGGE